MQVRLNVKRPTNDSNKANFVSARFRNIGDLLRRCIYLARSAAHLLFCRVQKIEESFLPQSLSNYHPEVPLLRCVSSLSPQSRLLHPTRISSTLLGVLFNVSILSFADDLCIAGCLLMGGGELTDILINWRRYPSIIISIDFSSPRHKMGTTVFIEKLLGIPRIQSSSLQSLRSWGWQSFMSLISVLESVFLISDSVGKILQQ